MALLTAREKHANYEINQKGFTNQRYRVYASTHAHSSVDKDVRIAGIGLDNLVKVDVDADFAMKPDALRAAMEKDVALGYHPLCVVSTIGSTSSTAIDPVHAIDAICKQFGLLAPRRCFVRRHSATPARNAVDEQGVEGWIALC